MCHALAAYIKQRLESNLSAKIRALQVYCDSFYSDICRSFKDVEAGAKYVILLEELRREEKLSQEVGAAVDERLADILGVSVCGSDL